MGYAPVLTSSTRFAFASLACKSTTTKSVPGRDRAICSYAGFTRWHGPHVDMDQFTTARALDSAACSRYARTSSAPFVTCRTEPQRRAVAGAAAGASAGFAVLSDSISASLAGSDTAAECLVDGDARDVG